MPTTQRKRPLLSVPFHIIDDFLLKIFMIDVSSPFGVGFRVGLRQKGRSSKIAPGFFILRGVLFDNSVWPAIVLIRGTKNYSLIF